MKFSRVVGTGSYLPSRVLHNRELETRLDTSDQWIYSRTGIRSRHIAADDELTSDLAVNAGAKAMHVAGIDAGAIDLVIVATCTPDMIFPSTACVVQRKLGIQQGAAFDINAACTGFVYAVAVADRLIAGGQHGCALVIGADTFSRLVDWNDRRTCVLFGDGAGAVILSRSSTAGVLSSHLHSEGAQGDILRAPGHVRDGRLLQHEYLSMDGQAVFKFAVRALEQASWEALSANDMAPDKLDWIVPHQANLRIIEATALKLGIQHERIVRTVEHHGNTSAASVPLALDAAIRDSRIRAGNNVLLKAVGAGMTWGSVLLVM